MARKKSFAPPVAEQDLSRWRLIVAFRKRLANAVAKTPLAATWSHPERALAYADYLSLFLFGLLNPVVRTMRGLCAASRLERV